MVYQSTGENALAEAQFQAALQVDPTLSRARNNYAAFLYSQGRFAEAEREFEAGDWRFALQRPPNGVRELGFESTAIGRNKGG